MGLAASIFFMILSLGFLAILILTFLRILQRERLLDGILGLAEASRNRLIALERLIVRVLGIALWLFPLYLVFVPLALFFFLHQAFVNGIICMVLLVGTGLQEYLFRKWLLNHIAYRLDQRAVSLQQIHKGNANQPKRIIRP